MDAGGSLRETRGRGVAVILARACAEIDAAVRRGTDARAEDWLARHPELAADPDAAVELIYAEYAAREERDGRPPPAAEFFARFPGLRDALSEQFRVHEFLADGGGAAGPKRSDPPPATVGPYELLEEIGRGGGGTVHRARHREHGRIVALKRLPAGPERALDEARAAARLEHPGLVRLYEVGRTDDSRAWLAMELVAGGGLDRRLGGWPQAPRVAAALAERLARAVAAAHAAGVVHGDLKPANVLMRGAEAEPLPGDPVIADFGLARLAGSAVPDDPDRLTGTPGYMAPEQAAGRADIGPAADVYALGAILYETLTGRPPFRADTPLETLRQTLAAEPVAPDRLQPGVPRDLATVCLKCLAKDPAARYGGAGALADDLRRFLDGRPVLARPAGPLRRAVMWCRRNPAPTAVIGVVAVAVAAALALQARHAAQLSEALDETARQRDRAERQFESARREVFAQQLAQASDLWETDPGRAAEMLDDETRCPPELRDFAWRMLRRLCRRDRWRHPPPAGGVARLGFSADGRSVVAVGNDGSVIGWDAATGEATAGESALPPDPRPPIIDPAAGGTWIVRPSDGRRPLCVLRPAGGTRPGGRGLSADGRRLAVAAERSADRLTVWDVATAAPLCVLSTEGQPPLTLRFSPDGKRLAAACRDRAVRVWTLPDEPAKPPGPAAPDSSDAATPEDRPLRPALTLRGHERQVSHLAISPDGRTLASAGPDGVRLWPLEAAPDPVATLPNDSRVTGLAVAPDSSAVYVGCRDGTVRRWRIGPPAECEILDRHADAVMGLGLSPDGTRLAACDAVGAVRLTDLRTGKTAACRAASGRRAAALAFAPDGALFATGDVDGRVRFWDGATGGLVREVKEPSAVHALEFRPSDGMLAIACGDGSVTILDPATGAALSRRPCGERAVECLAFGPGADGGPILVTGSWDYAVRLRDGDGRVERAALTGHSEVVFSAAFGPDGRTLATGSGSRYFDVPGEVRLWDAATGRLHAEFKGRSGPVAFAPDGRFLVTCDPAGPIRLWPGR